MAVFKPTVDGLVDLYTEVIKSLGMEVDAEGLVSMDLGDGNKIPSNIGNKRMVIPTQELLRNGDFSGVVAFHPMAESVSRGESEVLKKYKNLINFRLTTIISCLLTELMEIAVNKDYHSKLTPTQSGLIQKIADVDAKTLESLIKILNKVSHTGENRLVSIYLKRGGTLNEAKYSRLAVANFPIADEFDNEDQKIFGVKLRVKDHKAIVSLFNYILPDAADMNTYSHGSNSMAAPYFHALSKSFIKVATQLNKVTKLFKKHLDSPNSLNVNVDWEESMEDLSIYRDVIPTLDGNVGETSVVDKEKSNMNSRTVIPGKSLFSSEANNSSPAKLEHSARKTAMAHLAESLGDNGKGSGGQAEHKSSNTRNDKSESGLSWAEINAKRTAMQSMVTGQGFINPAMTPPATPPPGWAGTTFTPQDIYSYQQNQFAAPGRFGQPEPRPNQFMPQPWNQPVPPQHNMNTPIPWNTGGNVYGGGI